MYVVNAERAERLESETKKKNAKINIFLKRVSEASHRKRVSNIVR